MPLARVIGIPGAVVLGLGSMVGTGVFVTLGLAAGVAGSALPLAIGIAGLVAMLNGLSSARLAARHPVAGGTAVYARRELHPMLGTIAGWLFLVAKGASAATAAIGLVGYLAPDAPRVAMVMPVLIACVIAWTGLRLSVIVTLVLVGIAVLALVTFGTTAAGAAGFEPTTAPTPARTIDLLHAGALVFVAFTGYGRIATLGEEIHDPARSIPRAVVITVLMTVALYLLVALAALHAVGATAFAEADGNDGPLASIARSLDAPGVGSMLSIGAVAAIGGVLLNLVLGLSRVVLALARDGDLPPLAAGTPGGRPLVAIIVVGTGVAILAVAGSIQAAWTTSAAAVLAYYGLTNLSALVAARRDRRPLGVAIGAGGCLGCLGLALALPAPAWIPTIAIAVIGVTMAAIQRRSGTTPRVP